MARYKPLEDYALVGNLETCALVGRDGSVDWLPVPHVESPSALAALLDADRGGRFAVEPSDPYESVQSYLERTNVLQTTFYAAEGAATLTDAMPVADGVPAERALYRRLECTNGRVPLTATFDPRPDYARADPTLRETPDGVVATGGGQRLQLRAPVDLSVTDGGATADFVLHEGDIVWFVLAYDGDDPADDATCARRLDDTVAYWRGWAHTCNEDECVFAGPWHDAAVRSGLVLKLLTHGPTGAVAAAPTTSLPEEVGGVRNWDYRYNWLRDAAFTIQALSNLGHRREAVAYHDWLFDLCRTEDPADIQPLYGLHGEHDLTEHALDSLEGYRGSAPVRVGNAAAEQVQLDIYGELLLALGETLPPDESLDPADWEVVAGIVEHVCEVWEEPDYGIWEVRTEPRQFVHSKLMCWTALDRGLSLADTLGVDAPRERWRETREDIRETVLDRGYDEMLGTFTRTFGSRSLDAATLLVPVVGFLPFDDPRVQGTIDAVCDRLLVDGIVRRYDGDDGIPGDEGAFCLTTCWLVDALALAGRVDEARRLFMELLRYVSDTGLLAEEVDPSGGGLLGNYPQGFSHVGIVNSALHLGQAHGRQAPVTTPVAVSLGEGLAVPTND